MVTNTDMFDFQHAGSGRGLSQESARLLIVDADSAARAGLQRLLEDSGYQATQAASVSQADRWLAREEFDVCVIDPHALSTSDPVGRWLQGNPRMRFVVLSAVPRIPEGAGACLPKPCHPSLLLQTVREQLRLRRRLQRLTALEIELESQALREPEPLLGSNEPAVQSLISELRRQAANDQCLLLHGEAGAGKSRIARYLHSIGPRREAAFVRVDCRSGRSSLAARLFGEREFRADSLLGLAEGGTLFIDEIALLPESLQGRLLRLIEHRSYQRAGDSEMRLSNARIIVGTQFDLGERVADGLFSEPLHRCLLQASFQIPPLRERLGDLQMLSQHLLGSIAQRMGSPTRRLGPDALELLLAHDWPDNLRELRNALEFAIMRSSHVVLEAGDLPLQRQALCAGDTVSLEALERSHIEAIVQRAPSLEAAARLLGIDSSTLYRKRKQFARVIPESRRPKAVP